jgi:hypothetical protein
LVLLSLDDDDEGGGEDSDVTLLRALADGVVPLSCLGSLGWCEDGVRLGSWDNVVGRPSAADSCGVTGDVRTPSSVALFEETLAVLLRQPMGLKSEEVLDI